MFFCWEIRVRNLSFVDDSGYLLIKTHGGTINLFTETHLLNTVSSRCKNLRTYF